MVVLAAVVEHEIPRSIVLEAATVLLVSDAPMTVISDLTELPTYAMQVRGVSVGGRGRPRCSGSGERPGRRRR